MTLHFQSVTVLGAGTMGHGIAHVCALAGINTVLYDVDLGAVDMGLKLIRKNLDKTVYNQIGIVGDKEIMAPGGRPIEIVKGGRVVTELLS